MGENQKEGSKTDKEINKENGENVLKVEDASNKPKSAYEIFRDQVE